MYFYQNTSHIYNLSNKLNYIGDNIIREDETNQEKREQRAHGGLLIKCVVVIHKPFHRFAFN